MFEEIKKKTNVSLSGDGADEVFFGYITFKAFYIMLQLKKVFPKFILIFLSKIFKFSSFSENYIDNKRKFYLFFKYIHEELSLINSFWINDLSAPDVIFNLPFKIPIYGDFVCALPIIMALSMYAQQRMMTAGGPQQEQQKMMQYFMMGFFFLLFNSFPSGLNLYYTLFNVLTIAQQKFTGDSPVGAQSRT